MAEELMAYAIRLTAITIMVVVFIWKYYSYHNEATRVRVNSETECAKLVYSHCECCAKG